MIKKMIPMTLVIWMSLVIAVTSVFICPEMKNCACEEETNWWLNNWTNVKVVNCSHRALRTIPSFDHLRDKTFHRLLLNNNNITDLTRNDFKNVLVREVVLRKNPLKIIPNDAFQEIRHVIEILDLDSVKITIDEGLHFLHGLYKLKKLDLGYNRLKNEYEEFPSEEFLALNLTSLTTLTLQALQITKIDDGAFSGIEGLEQLDLSYNFISDFPSELRKLTNLKGLKLYSNELTSIKNNTFAGLTELKKLLIGVNEITAESIESGALNDLADSIEEINFYQNPLMKVPSEVLQSLAKLRKLSLVKTNLEYIENGSFIANYKLKELHLDDNPKLHFEDEGMLSGIEDSLEVFYIRRLNLENLPCKVLRRLETLYYLDAADNDIKRIDRHFFCGLKLTHIKLMWNRIRHVDYRAFNMIGRGIILDLHDNDIRDISFLLQVQKCTFQELYLGKNDIPCDCTVEKVLNSGIVSWQVVGECFVEDEGKKRWYRFDDRKLMDHFGPICNRTKRYSSCFDSTSGFRPIHSIRTMLYCICIYLVLLV